MQPARVGGHAAQSCSSSGAGYAGENRALARTRSSGAEYNKDLPSDTGCGRLAQDSWIPGDRAGQQGARMPGSRPNPPRALSSSRPSGIAFSSSRSDGQVLWAGRGGQRGGKGAGRGARWEGAEQYRMQAHSRTAARRAPPGAQSRRRAPSGSSGAAPSSAGQPSSCGGKGGQTARPRLPLPAVLAGDGFPHSLGSLRDGLAQSLPVLLVQPSPVPSPQTVAVVSPALPAGAGTAQLLQPLSPSSHRATCDPAPRSLVGSSGGATPLSLRAEPAWLLRGGAGLDTFWAGSEGGPAWDGEQRGRGLAGAPVPRSRGALSTGTGTPEARPSTQRPKALASQSSHAGRTKEAPSLW